MVYIRLFVLVTAIVIVVIIVHFLSFPSAKIRPTPVIGELVACLLYRQFYHKTLICQTLFLIISLNSLANNYFELIRLDLLIQPLYGDSQGSYTPDRLH